LSIVSRDRTLSQGRVPSEVVRIRILHGANPGVWVRCRVAGVDATAGEWCLVGDATGRRLAEDHVQNLYWVGSVLFLAEEVAADLPDEFTEGEPSAWPSWSSVQGDEINLGPMTLDEAVIGDRLDHIEVGARFEV
jgi:hypothetical protein